MLGSGEGPCEEPFADIIDCLLGRVAHVLGVEAVIAELVHHDFVCREIVGRVSWVHAEVRRISSEEVIDAKKKSGFADLVAMGSVLEVAYWADSEDQLLSWTKRGNPRKGFSDF